MKNFRKNSITNQNNRKSNYKAISLASLSTLALTLTLGDVTKVNAVMGKLPANVARPIVKVFRSSGSINITPVKPQTRTGASPSLPITSGVTGNHGVSNKQTSPAPGTSPAFKQQLSNLISGGATGTTQGTQLTKPSTSGTTGKIKASTSTGTTTTTGTGSNVIKTTTSTGTSKSAGTGTGTKVSVTQGTQTDVADTQSTTRTQAVLSSKNSVGTQTGIDDDQILGSAADIIGNDNVSLSPSQKTTTTTSSVDTNKKLSKKQKLMIGVGTGIGVAGIATAVGLGVGLSNNNQGTQQTKGPNEVPVPKAPVNTNKVVNSGAGYLYTDE